MSQSISAKQLAILQFIYDYNQRSGYPPTVREICDHVQLSSTSTVHGHLTRLQKRGCLHRDPTKPRTLEITNQGLESLQIKPQTQTIPIIGTVTAGLPILAQQETAQEFFPFPPDLKDSSSELFMLTIQGDSMIQAGILDGDQVIVQRQPTAENGEIVIAMNSDHEATCKRFFREKNHIRLQAENDNYPPIILSQVQILGKVISLYRRQIF
ncbi:transcriptional repressor LexA [Lactobacillus sp. DCY120]|uniref:LexA repressor n=1 Tax=Bombilactobacillus apium TaxID=2675299 RepID=A0A850RE60_9LACO|nr:transcriptional repressor LexA [Bombilactobacillus apium]NVY97008.1 transcriptional repressor LexA [Bombilactobacillus apium]